MALCPQKLTLKIVAMKSFSAGFNALLLCLGVLIALVEYFDAAEGMQFWGKLYLVVSASVCILLVRVLWVSFDYYRLLYSHHSSELAKLNEIVDLLGDSVAPVDRFINHDMGSKPLIVLGKSGFENGQLLSLGVDLGGGLVQLGLVCVKGVNEQGNTFCELVYIKKVETAKVYMADQTRQKDLRVNSIVKEEDLLNIIKIEA